jgi:hypothetical protein
MRPTAPACLARSAKSSAPDTVGPKPLAASNGVFMRALTNARMPHNLLNCRSSGCVTSPLMEVTVNKASEHRQRADECRSLASQMETSGDREQRLRLADAWDRLAGEVEPSASPPRPSQPPGRPEI